MTSAEKYVTAAYAVVLAVVLLYVVIYAFKMTRLDREVEELTELAGEVERLRGASQDSPALSAGASPVRRVLDELRADERAREELRGGRMEPEQQRIELGGGEGD